MVMKMRKKILPGFIYVLLCLILIVGIGILPKRPLKNIRAEDINSPSVYVNPPDMSAQVADEDFEKLAKIISSLQVYGKAMDEIEPITGGGVSVELMTANGNIEISNIGNLYLCVNGKYYRGYYRPMDALDSFARKITQ